MYRPKTEAEKKEYKDLKQIDANKVFEERLGQVELQFTKERKPFCRPCAKKAWELHLLTMKHQNPAITDTKPEAIQAARDFDFTPYGKEDLFEFIGEQKENERRREGGDVWFELILNKKYVCKNEHGLTISVPAREVEGKTKPNTPPANVDKPIGDISVPTQPKPTVQGEK